MSFQLRKEGDNYHMTGSAAKLLQRLEDQIEKDYQTACEERYAPKRVSFQILYSHTIHLEVLTLDETQRDKIRDVLLDLEEKIFQMLETKKWKRSEWSDLKEEESE